MDLQGTQPSKYYSNVVVDPISGKQLDPTTGKTIDMAARKPEDVVLQWDDPVQGAYPALLTRYLGVFAGPSCRRRTFGAFAADFLRPSHDRGDFCWRDAHARHAGCTLAG